MTRLLLLAGTGEARQIGHALAQESLMTTVASLAGSTRTPISLGVPTRIGGFGGRAQFAEYLKHERITAVLDATHPFAAAMSHRTSGVCAEMGIPYMQFLRPSWKPGEGDAWTFLNTEEDAAKYIPEGSVVFLATGPATVERFSNLRNCTVYCRRIDPPTKPFPFEGGSYLPGRPPFSVEDEMELFFDLKVDWLVVKNSGGSASRSKLDAARDLGIPVALIRRPRQPEGPRVTTVSEALAWVRRMK